MGKCGFWCILYGVGGDVSFIKYLKYILGCGTWLYYVPLYLVITTLFNFHASQSFLILSLLISFSSCMFSYLNICNLFLSPFQNPLNWIGFYALGVMLKAKPFMHWAKNRISTIILLTSFMLLLSLITVNLQMKICYWNTFCFVIEILSFFLVSNLCVRLNVGGLLESLGKYSYLIYFLHMQFGIFSVNLIIKITELPEIIQFFIRPFLVIYVTYVYVRIIQYFVRLVGLQKYNKYLGIPVIEINNESD